MDCLSALFTGSHLATRLGIGTATPLDAHHYAIRLGNGNQVVRVLLDGEDVTNECIEAHASPGGWVIVTDTYQPTAHGTRHPVLCKASLRTRHDHVRTIFKTGQVVIETRPPKDPTP
jgi:hypothetical protein